MYEDPVSLLQPTIKVLRVLGVCPSSLRSLYIPTINKLYGTLLLTLGLTGRIIFANTLLNFGFKKVSMSIFLPFLIIDIVNMCLCLFSAFFKARIIIRFLKIVESAQQNLCSLNIRQPPRPTKKSQILWITFMTIPYLIIIIKLSFSNFRYVLMEIPSNVISLGTDVIIRVFLDLLKEKFELLVWHLDDLNNCWPQFLPRPPDVSFRELSCVREWRRSKFIQDSLDTRTLTADKVRDFNKAHLKLCYAFKTLNSAFSWILLLPSIWSGLRIAAAFAALFGNNFHSWFPYLVSIALGISKVLIVCSLSSKIQEMSRKVAYHVHDLLDEEQLDPDVLDELESFSQALLHREISLSAAGFYNIDLKLVCKMITMLAPIILFLYQLVIHGS